MAHAHRRQKILCKLMLQSEPRQDCCQQQETDFAEVLDLSRRRVFNDCRHLVCYSLSSICLTAAKSLKRLVLVSVASLSSQNMHNRQFLAHTQMSSNMAGMPFGHVYCTLSIGHCAIHLCSDAITFQFYAS
jgi:hypothetical protein